MEPMNWSRVTSHTHVGHKLIRSLKQLLNLKMRMMDTSSWASGTPRLLVGSMDNSPKGAGSKPPKLEVFEIQLSKNTEKFILMQHNKHTGMLAINGISAAYY
jgi:hypothetical protein